MSNIKEFYQDFSLEDYPIELLEASLESHGEDIGRLFAEVESLDAFMAEVLEDKNPTFSAEKYCISVEMIPSLEAVTDPRAGGIFRRMWDDYFATRQRLIQGIIDLSRSRSKNIQAYRRKLDHKLKRVLDVLMKKGDTSHEASFISIEKYWLYANDRYPGDPVAAVRRDYEASVEFMQKTPKRILEDLGKLEKIIGKAEMSDEEEFEKTVVKPMSSQLRPFLELVGKEVVGKPDLFLYRTSLLPMVRIERDADTRDSKSFQALTTPSHLKVVKGDWKRDVLNALGSTIAHAFPLPWLIGASMRLARTQGVYIKTRELKELYGSAMDFLDLAERSSAEQARYLQDVEKIGDRILKHVTDLNPSPDIRQNAMRLTNYISNASDILGKPYSEMIDRHIKVAKGINYLLMRTAWR